jgi:hypothetical protein
VAALERFRREQTTMAWWGWTLIAWAAVATVAAVWAAAALRIAERRDRVRRLVDEEPAPEEQRHRQAG